MRCFCKLFSWCFSSSAWERVDDRYKRSKDPSSPFPKNHSTSHYHYHHIPLRSSPRPYIEFVRHLYNFRHIHSISLNMPSFEEKPRPGSSAGLEKVRSRDTNNLQKIISNGSISRFQHTLSIPGEMESDGPIEVPASRSSIAETDALMHSLSLQPSQQARRGSRNSFGASLPIPRTKRQSRLSSVANADGVPTRPGMPPIQPTREILSSQVQDMSHVKTKAAKDMAFAFDIDGVLVHGDRLIPQGKRVLEILNGDNELGIKIPHIFLTNGSGKPEAARCEQLSKILHSPVSTEQFIQAHTPMSALKEYYETVLVVGGEGYRCREVAQEYGFKNIIVPNDIYATDSTISPLREHFTAEQRATSTPRDFSKVKIDAILVFSDSRDYGKSIPQPDRSRVMTQTMTTKFPGI